MKAFPAHVKEFEVVYDRKATTKRGAPKTKWVKVVLQVPTSQRRVAQTIANSLSRHMCESRVPRWLNVIHPFGPEMSVIRAAKNLLAAHLILGADQTPVTVDNALHSLGLLFDAVRELPKSEKVLV